MLFTSFASALEIPALKARVNDYANMLSPQTRNELEIKLEELEKTDSTQVVVLTLPSLEGDALESFSIRVAEKWKIGQKKLDNGAILVIAKNDRKVRIEVGYGLEGKLTDLISGRIIGNIIIPNFRNDDFDRGVSDGIDAIISVVKGEFKADAFKDRTDGREKSFFSGNGIFFLFFFLFFIGIIGSIKRIFGGVMGAVVFPIIGLFTLPISIWLLLLIPIGFAAGLILPVILPLMRMGGGGGFPIGRGGGGFSSGGFGGGGGGGFGGGGASGSW